MAAGLVGGRLSAVTTALADAKTRLQQVAVIHDTPSQLHEAEAFARFESGLHEALVADVAMAFAYLHAPVGRVVISSGGELEVTARNDLEAPRGRKLMGVSRSRIPTQRGNSSRDRAVPTKNKHARPATLRRKEDRLR